MFYVGEHCERFVTKFDWDDDYEKDTDTIVSFLIVVVIIISAIVATLSRRLGAAENKRRQTMRARNQYGLTDSQQNMKNAADIMNAQAVIAASQMSMGMAGGAGYMPMMSNMSLQNMSATGGLGGMPPIKNVCLFILSDTDRAKCKSETWRKIRAYLPKGVYPQAFTVGANEDLPPPHSIGLDRKQFNLKYLCIDIGHMSTLGDADAQDRLTKWVKKFQDLYPSIKRISLLTLQSSPNKEVVMAAATAPEACANGVTMNVPAKDSEEFIAMKLLRMADNVTDKTSAKTKAARNKVSHNLEDTDSD